MCRRITSLGLFFLLLSASGWAHVGEIEAVWEPAQARLVETKNIPVKFSVATYNVQARPFFDRVGAKFQAIGPLLNRFDLVALQECFVMHRLLWQRSSHASKIHDGTRTDWYRPAASGLCTLARFPVRETIVEKFEHLKGIGSLLRAKKDGLASKGILLVRLDFGNGRVLDFYNTHLEAGSDKASNEARRRQAKQLIRMIRAHSPPEHAVILAGDLNMRPPRIGKKALGENYPRSLHGLDRAQLYEAICRELGLLNSARVAGDKAVPPLIDHILFRSGTRLQLTPVAWEVDRRNFVSPSGEPWSDHDPVIATFRAMPRP